MSNAAYPPIAVVGASALFPGMPTTFGFWRNILEGNDLLSEVPSTHWLIEDYYDPDPRAPDKTYAERGGFLTPVDFSPMEFGVPPNIVPATDTAQLLSLLVAKEVLKDASGSQFDTIDRDRISVVLGVASATELVGHMSGRLQMPVWERGLRKLGLTEDKVKEFSEYIASGYQPWQESTFPGLLGNVVAGRIANRLDLGGTNCVVDAACASSLAALDIAVNELYLGQSDVVITGGVDTLNDILMFMCFSKTTALSPSNDCRPFSDKADGTMLGEGIGMVALKRLDDAERDGDTIYGVIKAVGSSSDGRAKSIYAPVSSGQAKALVRAYDRAGYGPETVELVEAHGTGTKAGDAAEFGGLAQVFSPAAEERQWCALGSVKSQVGHTKASAGSAGLFKIVMALHHKVLPPTIKVDRPNPLLELETSPFYLNTETRPWVRGSDHPRRGSVSSFGFGGTNFHIALEEYVGDGARAHRLRAMPCELFTFGAATPAALAEALTNAAADVRADDAMFAFLARHTQETFSASSAARVSIVADDAADLASKLDLAAGAIRRSPDAPFSTPTGVDYGVGPVAGDVAFLYPGQGSQYVGMGRELAIHFDQVRGVFDRAADLDLAADGTGLHDVVWPIPVFSDENRKAQQAHLTATEWAQPAIGAVSAGVHHVLGSLGIKPACVGGHSYGELTSLWSGGAYGESDFLKVSRKRGELMADAASIEGTMTAVVADIDAVRGHITASGHAVVVANHNSPTQVVVSGPTDQVAAFEGHLGANGVKFKRLQVATAFHSPLVAGSSAPFQQFLEGVDFHSTSLPVYANATAAPYAGDADASRRGLSEQIASSVRFVEQIEAMYAAGVRVFVEVGPNAVLTNLVGRVLGDRPHTAIQTDRKGKHGVTTLWRALGQLAASGVELDLAPLWNDYKEIEDPRTLKKSPFTLKIGGANYGKPQLEEPEVPPTITYHQPAQAPAPAPAPVAAAPVAAAPVAVAPATPAPVAPAPAAGPSSQERQAWLHSFQDLQERTAGAHEDYQRQMIGAHTAFLQMAETSMRSMASILSGNAPAVTPVAAAPAPVVTSAPAFALPSNTYANSDSNGHANGHTSKPAFTIPPVIPEPARVEARAPAAPVVSKPRPTPKPAPAAPAPVAPVASAAPAVDMTGLMLEVVSEKTGYPVEMLDLSMGLEADLGIDSIKRVEILSAMQDKVPSLPEVETSKMASLVTLQEIVTYMSGLLGDAPQAAPAPAAAPVASAPAAPAAPSVDMTALMLEVVSEKTGYPVEMLDLNMELEADLGIDSIKRVEILSAMQDKVPSLPEVETSKMASLVTLQEIVTYMSGLLGDAPQAAPAAPAPVAQAPAAPAAPAAPSVDMTALMLEVVAEKTGYPAEMLDLSMELEADLGIDSIKRVEILSAMQDKVPSLPEVETSKMASLVTLQEIVTYMSGLLGDAPQAAPAPAAAPVASAPSAPSVDMTALMLEVVAEKTGYPAEMLDLGMELEADLGIDSIKRVEILSAMQDKVPSLPEVETSKMASLVTLQEIVTYMSGLLGGTAQAAPAPVAPPVAPAPAAPSAPASTSGPSHDDLVVIMLEVVSEKTGYPSEMLDLDMELEADLGVDSIKRVEILSAMQDRVPSLPEVDTTQLAALSTLRQIVDSLGGSLAGGSAAPTSAASAVPDATSTVAGGLARYAVGLVAEPAPGFTMKGLESARTVEITQDGRGVAQALAVHIEQHGPQVFIVEAPTGDHDAVIFLGGLEPVASEADALAIDRAAFAAARAVAARFESSGEGVFVTAQDTGGAFSLDAAPSAARARLGAIAGLAKTCAVEWPGVSVKAIDVSTDGRAIGDVAEAIASELFAGGTAREVALGDGGAPRRVVHAPVTPVGQASLTLGSSDVIVVSGGARGVTAASIIALATRTKAKFVLLGRTALSEEPAAFHGIEDDAGLKRAALGAAKAAGEKISPRDLEWRVGRVKADREVRGTVAAITAAGGQARYVTADVRDASSLDQAFATARSEWGPITGVVHGAGVLADALISKKTDDQFDRVFDTKVLGLRALLDATASDPIKLVCAFSSVAARTGNTGQSDYAMANEVLNKSCLALASEKPGLVVKSIGWGPWDSGMVTPGLKKMFEARGIRLIGLVEGAEAFADEVLDGTSGQVEVVIGGGVGAGGLDDLVPEQGALQSVATASAALQPYLDDHRVQGTVVLPVVQATEWIARAARASRAGASVLAIRDIEVKKGITLEGWGSTSERFDVKLEAAEVPGLLSAALVDQTGRTRYGARVELSAALPAPPNPWTAPANLKATPSNLYASGALFHGPAFQVLREVTGAGMGGATASLVGCEAMEWPDEGWVIDPALVDGCLQLALIWGLGVTKAQTLPLRIAELKLYAPAPFSGPLHCTLVGKSHTAQRTVSDIQVTADDGAVVLELLGVEMYAVPGGA